MDQACYYWRPGHEIRLSAESGDPRGQNAITAVTGLLDVLADAVRPLQVAGELRCDGGSERFAVLRQDPTGHGIRFAEYDLVVIEGAGSVSELNLRPHDLVNLGLVTRLGVPWILVADIERG